MNSNLRGRYKILLIVFVSLAVYYPSLFGEINSLDDQEMVSVLINTERFDWKGIFLPERPFHYYRPLLWITFLCDQFVFGCTELFMHLNNILLHTLNGILVFLIMREICRRFEVLSAQYVPIVVALLFIVHPINTEPVNFISGRTDVLAATFVLLSLLVFLTKGMTDLRWSVFASVLYLGGLLSKEVALGLLPVVGTLLILREPAVRTLTAGRRIVCYSPYVLVTVGYFVLRFAASGSSDQGVVTAVGAHQSASLAVMLSAALKAFGFYVKKLLIPVPLNFGIIEIDRMFYFYFGIVSLAASLYVLVFRRNLETFFILLAVLFFLPAIPVAMTRMAWTPLAERYLYISSIGISALLVAIGYRYLANRRSAAFALTLLAILCAGAVTVHRNIVWQSNLTLYEDTVQKSPAFAAARNEYGLALMKIGRYDEAREQFQAAQELAGNVKYKELPGLNLAEVSGIGKDAEEHKRVYLDMLRADTPPEIAAEILHRVIRVVEGQLRETEDDGRKGALYHENISLYERLFEIRKNGFYLYRVGQLYVVLGERQKAVEYFRRSLELSPTGYHAQAARKLIEKLDRTAS